MTQNPILQNLSSRLRHKIFFLSPVSTVNPYGEKQNSYNEYDSCWAEILTDSSSESISDIATINSKLYTIIIRYKSDINTEMRIRFNDVVMRIESLENIDYEEIALRIKAVKI